MEPYYILAAVIIVVIFWKVCKNSNDGIDPSTMSDHQLVSSIAGQADALEKIKQAPYATQMTPAIVELTQKRRAYLAQMCLELLQRESLDMQVFFETTQIFKALVSSGIPQEVAAMNAVKEVLFASKGIVYSASWID